jgi:hypothetical protein
MESVWVFSGEGANLPAAVFTERDVAEAWILKHKVSGVLTEYPLNVCALDWAVERGYFKEKAERHRLPEFVQRFFIR